jgi:GAF domain-containing protein
VKPKPSPTAAEIADVMEITASTADPHATFRALEALAGRTVGHTLFTVTRNIEASQEVERVYSSNPAAYPLGGRKQKEGTRWGDVVLDRGEVFLARDRDELRAAFPDYELIFSLGIEAILNVPIRYAGRCIGTLNLCGKAGQYDGGDVRTGRVLAALLVPVVMVAKEV